MQNGMQYDIETAEETKESPINSLARDWKMQVRKDAIDMVYCAVKALHAHV